MPGSTERYERAYAIRLLLSGPFSEPVTVGFEGGKTLLLQREVFPVVYAERAVSWRLLPGGLGYIRIPSWDQSYHVARIVARALAALRHTRGLIIDQRENVGGDDSLASHVIGRLVTCDTDVTHVMQRFQMLGIMCSMPRVTREVIPECGWHYRNPVVVLTDTLDFSAGEFFVAALKYSGRATIIGETTAGSSGSPRTFHAGPITYRVSTWREYRLDGTLIEGHGVDPDITVAPKLDDLRKGLDTCLEAGISFLNKK
jgi:C-terminal processing protease CtpA/Prc